MSGPHEPKAEVKYLNRVKKYPDQIMMAPENAVTEGFQYFETQEYLSKPHAINRKRNMLKMFTQFGIGEFAKTAKAFGDNAVEMMANQKKNYDDVEQYVEHLETTGAFPSHSSEIVDKYPNSDLWNRLASYAWENHGVRLGFAEVTQDMIFKGKAVPFPYALVCIQEMGKPAFDAKPIVAAGREVVKVYNSLGKATNDLAEWLRRNGVICQANHPFGGLVDFVPLSERAGLGRIGHNGLLITPDWGMRQRISPIYIKDKIFQTTETDDHSWIDDFCNSCRNCERECPASAIYPKPKIVKDKAFGERPRAETIDRESCFSYFSQTLGCSQCIRVCPFNGGEYHKIKDLWDKAQNTTNPSIGSNPLAASLHPKINKEPSRVAVVGSGPAGIFAVQELLHKTRDTQIDLIEALPVPFGLLRFGVAPDHTEVKSKSYYFHDIIRDPRVHFFGNTRLGKDIELSDLQNLYDGVILSTGASGGRKMSIPGNDLIGSLSAPEFVAWYNSHPEHQDISLPQRVKTVTIVGLGNVTLDCARMLLKPSSELQDTDISSQALVQISRMAVSCIHIVGRRGPFDANFTPKELIEFIELPGIQPRVNIDDLFNDSHSNLLSEDLSKGDFSKGHENLKIFYDIAQGKYQKSGKSLKTVYFHFFSTPKEIRGKTRVKELVLDWENKQQSVSKKQKSPNQDTTIIPCSLIIHSIGYKSDHIPGIPVQDTNGIILNEKGRIIDNSGTQVSKVYCAGWVRRGPTGIIGTNKTDAKEVIDSLIVDYSRKNENAEPKLGIQEVLRKKEHVFITKEQMETILNKERLKGSQIHKRAWKFNSVETMLDLVREN